MPAIIQGVDDSTHQPSRLRDRLLWRQRLRRDVKLRKEAQAEITSEQALERLKAGNALAGHPVHCFPNRK
jgi:hypothetical protein